MQQKYNIHNQVLSIQCQLLFYLNLHQQYLYIVCVCMSKMQHVYKYTVRMHDNHYPCVVQILINSPH